MSARSDWSILFGWVATLVLVRAARLTERDPYWQAREGVERWAGTPLTRPDSWTWGEHEGIFRPTSPAWNSLLGLGYERAGVVGISLVGALGIAAYFLVAITMARRLGARPLPTLLATMGMAMLVLSMVSPRATIVVQALMLAVLGIGGRFLVEPLPRTPLTFLACALGGTAFGWLGAWLHVSWAVTAMALTAALPAMALLAGASRRGITLALVTGAALQIGSALGPYGLSVWQLLLDISSASTGQVIEWLPPSTPGLRGRWLLVAVLCLALIGACAFRLARQDPGPPGSPQRVRWALEVVLVCASLVAAVAGLLAIRFLGIAALTLLPALASHVSMVVVQWRSGSGNWIGDRLTAAYWRPILTAVLAVLLPLALINARHPGRPVPEGRLAAALPHGCRLFSDPNTAGAILLLRPDVKVWIDMRTEVHGAAAYDDTRRRLLGPEGVRLPTGTSCALLPQGARSVRVGEQPSVQWHVHASARGFSLWLPG